MPCTEFELRMQELIDTRQPPEADTALVEHAATCPSCRELLQGQELLLTGIRSQNGQALPNGFAERVVSVAITRRRMRVFGPVLAAAAVAACLAFIILAPHDRSSERITVASIQPARGAVSSGNAISSARPTTTAVRQIQSEQYRDLIRGLLLQVHRIPQLEPVDQIANSIRLLASTLNMAIDFLWRSTFAADPGTDSHETSINRAQTHRITLSHPNPQLHLPS